MLSRLQSFIAIDLETTGLDPDKDEIIEIGAVKFIDGQELASFNEIVFCDTRLSSLVLSITGLSDAQVAAGVPLEKALIALEEFSQGLPYVAHNAEFDMLFLKSSWKKAGKLVTDESKIESNTESANVTENVVGNLDSTESNSEESLESGGEDSEKLEDARDLPLVQHAVFDSLVLSRIAWPDAPNHRLDTLGQWLELPSVDSHRALPDAQRAGLVFLKAQQRLSEYSQQTLSNLAHVATYASGSWKELFVQDKTEAKAFFAEHQNPDTGIEAQTRLSQVNDNMLRQDRIDQIAGPNGIAEKEIPGFESRKTQLQMMHLTARAIHENQILAVEAGTGTGKSLAYLLPLALNALHKGRRAMVTTATKALQHQLLDQEISTVEKLCGGKLKVAILKGRENYICVQKYSEILEYPSRWLGPTECLDFLALITWMESTQSGDIMSNSGFNPERNPVLWSKLRSDARSPIDSSSPLYERCFYHRSRRFAANAHILIANHSLFMRDLQYDFSLIPTYDVLVIDEAHKLRDTAYRQLGRQVTFFRLRHLMSTLQNVSESQVGLLKTIADEFSAQQEVELANSLTLCWDKPQSSEKSLQKFLNRLARNGKKASKETDNKLRFKGMMSYAFNVDPSQVLSELQSLLESLRNLHGMIQSRSIGLAGRLAGITLEIEDFRRDFEHICTGASSDEVYWLEDFQNPHKSHMRSCPLDLDEALGKKLESLESVVLTSATLSFNGQLQYFLRSIGLGSVDRRRLETRILKSPFDFAAQRKILLPSFTPHPTQKGSQQELNQILAKALPPLNTSTLVLYTSVTALRNSRNALWPSLSSQGRKLFAQHVDGSHSNVLHLFRNSPDACLMGTDAFWEGIDLPGRSLRLLVITKLPFPVPSDPIVAAQSERLEEQGINPFYEFFVPETVLRLKQGLGRLIRNSSDHGVIWICDPRLLRERYARAFFKSWEQDGQVVDTIEDLINITAKALDLPHVEMENTGNEVISSETPAEVIAAESKELET